MSIDKPETLDEHRIAADIMWRDCVQGVISALRAGTRAIEDLDEGMLDIVIEQTEDELSDLWHDLEPLLTGEGIAELDIDDFVARRARRAQEDALFERVAVYESELAKLYAVRDLKFPRGEAT